jgi:hypothetical protein
MKKIFVLLLVCVCFLFTGCNIIGGTGFVQHSDGSITEYYFVPFNAEEIVYSTDITLVEIVEIRQNIRIFCDALMNEYIEAYKQRIEASEDYTDEQKEALIEHGVSFDSNFNNKNEYFFGLESKKYVMYELFFANKLCYLEFKGANPSLEEQKEVVVESNLFTTTTKTIKDPMLDNIATASITLGRQFTQLCEQQMIQVIGQSRWAYNKLILNFDYCSSTFVYFYIVPTGRVHSNAKEIVCYDSMYYHLWNIPVNNASLDESEQIKFEYWTVTANKWVWYALALIVSGVIIAGVIFTAKAKEKKEVNQMAKILDD